MSDADLPGLRRAKQLWRPWKLVPEYLTSGTRYELASGIASSSPAVGG